MRIVFLALVACAPRGYYVANVYSVKGQLVQEKCEITAIRGRPDPDTCHLEPIQPLRGEYEVPQNLFGGLPPPRLLPQAD